jgi:hypothetical protein
MFTFLAEDPGLSLTKRQTNVGEEKRLSGCRHQSGTTSSTSEKTRRQEPLANCIKAPATI